MKNPFTEDYVRGLEEGRKHQSPSPITLERLDKLESYVQGLPVELITVKNGISNINEKLDGHTEVHEKIEKLVTYTNGRVRLLEKFIWLGMGGLAVLSYFFAQDRLNLINTNQIANTNVWDTRQK